MRNSASSRQRSGDRMTEKEDPKKYCFQIKFDKQWGCPWYIYVISENMEKACEYARTKKNWQQEIAECKLMGLAP